MTRGKIDDFEFRGVSQEVIDFKDQVSESINFGKVRPQVVASAPTWIGRNGEWVWFINAGTGRLYVNTADNVIAWSKALEWTI